MSNCILRGLAFLAMAAYVIVSSASFDKTPLRSTGQKYLGGRLEPHDQPDEAIEFQNLKRAPGGHGPIPAERYIKAAEHLKRMPQYSTVLNRLSPPMSAMETSEIEAEALGAWTQLGPGNIGGRTRALLIHPTTPSIMYAAGVAGGVWKTTNGGQSWTALNDLLPNLAVCSMAFDPTDSNVIYAGTGEGFFNSDMVRGAGIFKTTDAGATWAYLQSTATSDFYYVNDIVLSPNNNQRVYAATRTGVWLSVDGGANWSRSLNPLALDGLTVLGGCLDLAIRTDRSTDFLFASCGNLAQATVYRNTDAAGAGAWTPVLNESQLGRTSLAIAPSNQNIIYGLASSIESGNFSRGLLAVFRSDTSGDAGSWNAAVRNTNSTKLNTVLLSNPLAAFSSECGGGTNSFLNQGWYDNAIAVDPINPDRVWVGGVDLFRSDDGGASWGLASYWWAPGSDAHLAHADQHLIVFHPQFNGTTNRMMFVASDGGVFRTDDALATVATGSGAPCDTSNTRVVWSKLNNNYGVTEFYHGLPYPNGATYFGGTQDNGTLRGTDATGVNAWSAVFGGDGGYVAIDPTNTDTFYVETTRLSIRKTTDGGAAYASVTAGITESSGNFMFINPFTMDPRAPQILWTGGRTLWRTSNAAASWTQASTQITTDRSVGAIAVAPTNSNFVLAGTSGGFIHRTGNGLTSDSNTNWPGVQPRSGFVSWLAFDPLDPNVAYATYSTFGGTHVWRSSDAGANWNGIDGVGATGIPDVPVHCIAVDPGNSQRLYVGTDVGVFVSLDGGATWARENTGFANVMTESLAVGSIGRNNVLFAFTHGRGVWRVPLGAAALKINAAAVAGKRLLVFGQGFDAGAKVLLIGQQQKTANDELSPNTNLIAKKAGKQIPSGQTVILQVRNSDGALSSEFSFTRP